MAVSSTTSSTTGSSLYPATLGSFCAVSCIFSASNANIFFCLAILSRISSLVFSGITLPKTRCSFINSGFSAINASISASVTSST